MVDEVDYDRLKAMQAYIAAHMDVLRDDLVPHYKLHPTEFEYVVIRAGIGIFWARGDLPEANVETFLMDRCAHTLSAKQIIDAFGVFHTQVTKQSIRDAVSHFYELYPEYAPRVTPPVDVVPPTPSGTTEQCGGHRTGNRPVDPVAFTCALFAREGYRVFGKVFHTGQIVDGLGQKKRPSNLCSKDLGRESCQLYRDSVGLAETSRDCDNHAARMLFLFDELGRLKATIYHVNKAYANERKKVWLQTVAGLGRYVKTAFCTHIRDTSLDRSFQDKTIDDVLHEIGRTLGELIEDELVRAEIDDFIDDLGTLVKVEMAESAQEVLGTLFALTTTIQKLQDAMFENLHELSEGLGIAVDLIMARLGTQPIDIRPVTKKGREIRQLSGYRR